MLFQLSQTMTVAAKFSFYDGYLMGLPVNEHHLVFRWNIAGKVLFSVCRKGNAVSVHFASDRIGLRHLRQAFNECRDFLFDLFPWCELILVHIGPKSIQKVVLEIGFIHLASTELGNVFVRYR